MFEIGLQKLSLIDFPGEISAIFFFPGCNLACPYCHNPGLVSPPFDDNLISIDEAFAYLEKRRKVLGGVVLSGGEPLLHDEIPAIIDRIHSLGLKVKLDTNGTFPEKLSGISADYIAMDVKTTPSRYGLLCGSDPIDAVARIAESIGIITKSGIACEFRTTVVPGIVENEDIMNIASMLSSDHKLILAQFRPGKTLDPAYADITPYPSLTLSGMKEIARGRGIDCTIRGA